jgi:hypothetical protein
MVIALCAGIGKVGSTDPTARADSIAGSWIGEDAKQKRQVVRLDRDGSYSAGVVRNGDYQVTIFGRYEYAGDRLVVSFQNGATESGKIEWKDRNTFRYTVQESSNSKLAVGKTIEYSRINPP